MENYTRKTAIAKLADFLNEITLLFPPLKLIALEIASFLGLIDMLIAESH